MAAFIIDVYGKATKWHVGQKLTINYVDVAMVQADRDELEYIRDHFTGIRMGNTPVVVWNGQDAKFIADNIELNSK
jgi:hypothetical protein